LGASKVWRSVRWASFLFLAAMISWALSDPWSARGFQLWLELVGVLLGAGAVALIIAAIISYRRQRTDSLFREDFIAEPKPRVLWGQGSAWDLNEKK
jgi:hypothetical protein